MTILLSKSTNEYVALDHPHQQRSALAGRASSFKLPAGLYGGTAGCNLASREAQGSRSSERTPARKLQPRTGPARFCTNLEIWSLDYLNILRTVLSNIPLANFNSSIVATSHSWKLEQLQATY